MNNRPFLASATALAALPALTAMPARAMPLAAIELPAVAVAALGAAPGCDRLGQTGPGGMQGVGKSSAILGGQVSQLDLIRQQQAADNGTAIASAASRAPSGAGLAPAAAPAACRGPVSGLAAAGLASPGLALPAPSPFGFRPGTGRPLATGPDDFLGSKRLAVSKTVFDGSWNRVSHQGLSQRFVSGTFGGGAPTLATLAAVNAWSNARIRYEEDSRLYGRADYWANAGTTLSRGAGDCEDIAILKMQILAALGIPRSDMYLTIARDLTRRADHALLVVKLDKAYWLLDNATSRPLDAAQSYDYQPILSFSTSHKWLHGY